MIEKRIECLMWCDSPTTSTGFATVSKNILKVLNATEKYRFTVLGIAHLGLPFSTQDHPYLEFPKHGGLFSAQEGNDVYGMQKALRLLAGGTFDVLFILNDPFVMKFAIPQIIQLREGLKHKFKIVFYFPTDCQPRKEWADTVALVDFPVAYTQFGLGTMQALNEHLAGKLQFIYHGTDKAIFKPIVGPPRDMLKKTIFGHNAEKFIILNVNRNQPRKDLNSMFQVFAKLHAKRPKTFLYVLAAMNDVGGNLDEIARQHGLTLGVDWECPNPKIYSPNQGMPIENVVQLYAASDLVITTTLGEGWGLSVTEAMACRKPIVAPRHSSLVEIIGDNEERGWLVPAGGFGHTVCQGPQDNNNVRPVVHHDEMVERIKKVIDYPKQSEKKVQAAFDWVPSWEEIGQEWVRVFGKASAQDQAPEIGPQPRDEGIFKKIKEDLEKEKEASLVDAPEEGAEAP